MIVPRLVSLTVPSQLGRCSPESFRPVPALQAREVPMHRARPRPPATRSPRARLSAGLVALGAVMLSLQTGMAAPALAADPVPQMYQDQAFPVAGSAPTEDKPQSKLWFNDGSWWALMRSAGNGPDGDPDVTVHRLLADHTWRDTGTIVDTRSGSTGDALWEGGKLYVASRVTDGEVRAVRLSYATASDTYSMDAGFPKAVGSGSIESVTIARDSLSRLWVTFTKPDPANSALDRVWVAHSTTSDTSWAAPYMVPVPDNTVKADDISAIVSFAGKVGVMWSDQQTQVMRFAVHPDTSADSAGWTLETPYAGTRAADDHINLKSLTDDDQGRIYAAVKTSLGDSSSDSSSSPSLLVLSRSATGEWTPSTVATVGEKLTRPQLILDATNRQLYVVMATEAGGKIYYRRSPLGAAMSFTPKATMLSWSGALLNNPTTAKAPVTAASGIVVLASDTKSTSRYYHAELALAGGADLTAPTVPTGVSATASSPTSVTVSWSAATDAVGVASYRVTRNGVVLASAVTGGTSYVDASAAAGTAYSYTVSAVDAAANRSAESTAAAVTTPTATTVPAASFTATPTSGTAPLAVQFTDTSTGGPTSWAWTFGDGTTSTAQNPSHTYGTAGSFPVTLKATNAAGASTSSARTITATAAAPSPGTGITVGASSVASGPATTAVTVPGPAGVRTGDLVIAQFTTDAAPSVTAAPAGWSAVVPPVSVGTNARLFVYSHVVTDAAAEPASHTWTLSTAQKWNAGTTAFSGVDRTTPFDTVASTKANSSASTKLAVPGVTTSRAGALLVGGVGIDSGSVSVTPPSGWTEELESTGQQVTETAHALRSTAGATGTSTWALSRSMKAAGWVSALRPAS